MEKSETSENEKPKGQLSPESQGLEPLVGENVVIGYDKNINGPGARLVEFQPTRAEMMILGHHYLEMFFETEIWCRYSGTSGSSEWRELAYSKERFFAIAKALDPVVVPAEFQQAITEWEKKLSEVRCVHDE